MHLSTRQHALERADMVSRDTAQESVGADNTASSGPPKLLSLSRGMTRLGDLQHFVCQQADIGESFKDQ